MNKKSINPQTLMYPLPSVMVSCGDVDGEKNIITISWTGIIASDPPMLSISVRPERYSYKFIKENMDFVVNIPDIKLARENDFCGVKSGREVDKFKELKLTAAASERIKSPIIKECPINLECKVQEVLELGSHHMFVAEIVNVQVDEKMVENNSVELKPEDFFVYIKGKYVGLGEVIGTAGYSLK
ncbi:flavin reductase family protein [Alkaliphilus serpentinus]|uniref:Flavin reductase family protein n=1 Tax=Alkaliphilus serpentinus TaxID=1482731 RepID=A0A833HN61_9FIRM|nr:flavin reductase family protein [Alkaliphilus serpentinus]KAB3529224.1 flavin reductase family protein [Alkaliphilus serpentinus]